MSWGSQKGGEKNETVETFLDRRRCSWNGRTDLDYRCNLHLYIECKRGGKSLKNKLYTRYTQEHGQLKLSKKGK